MKYPRYPCPTCGTPMRVYARGATLRKHGPRWVCPAAEAEEYRDERGHIKRRADARHERIRWYDEYQLRPADPAPEPASTAPAAPIQAEDDLPF